MSKVEDLSHFPKLSNGERDWRWTRVQQMMAKNRVEVLLVLPDNPFDMIDNWFTNDAPGAVVIFPISGEPTAVWAPGAFSAGPWIMAKERGETAWVSDWRFHPASVIQALKERGFDGPQVGTLGLTDGGHFAPKGAMSHNMWLGLKEAFPAFDEWVPMMREFAPIWGTKSEEDLALFRHAARISESACEVAVETAHSGVNELELYVSILTEIIRHGAVAPGVLLHSGRENIGHYLPKWLSRSQERRTIQSGDEIHIELALNCAGAHVQGQQAIAVGEVGEDVRKAAELARESYEICLRELKPGVRFGDVCEAMQAPHKREGAWQLTPLIHSVSPGYMVDQPSRGIENMGGLKENFKGPFYEREMTGGDVVIQAGMVFQAEPNAVVGSRNYVDVGGNIIVTENGCEPLNIMPTEMRFVS
jgi:Xaa-Pro aminopeptidase